MAENKKTVTLRTVAAEAGLSRTAASEILGNPGTTRFPEATRQRVFEAARRLRYRPNYAARTLRSGRSRLIGLVTPWNVPELIDTVELAIREKNYRTMLQFTVRRDETAEAEALHAAIDRGVDGIIWLPANPAHPNQEVMERIRDNGVRLVFLERPCLECPVVHDLVNLDMTGPLFDYLESSGPDAYAEIIAVVPPMFAEIWGAEARAFEKRLRSLGLPARTCALNGDLSALENARKLMPELPAGKRALIICLNEWVAVRLSQEAEAGGLRIPADFGLISFGDFLIGSEFRSCEMARPPLTAMRRPYDRMGRKAVELLVRRIEAAPGDAPGSVVTLPGILVERASTLPAAAADTVPAESG